MAWDNFLANTNIRTEDLNNLSISIDNFDDGVVAILLHIPYMPDHEHSHIELNRKQAKILHEWLDKFLSMSDDELVQRIKADMKKNRAKLKKKIP